MPSSFRKHEKAKTRKGDSADARTGNSWRLYFGRTPGGIPVVRVARKGYQPPDTRDSSEGAEENRNR